MDSIPINIFFLVFLTTLTGSFMQIVWNLCKKIWGHKNPFAIYMGLKVVCMGYIIPVIYVLSLWHFHNSFYEANQAHDMVKKLQLLPFFYIVLSVLAAVWVCLFLVFLCYRMVEYLNWKSYVKKELLETDIVTVEVLKDCAENFGIKKLPKVYKKKDLSSPLCTGVFVKMILLPDMEYSCKELEVVFMHELTHIKKHDLEMKCMAIAITIFHCFNPMVYRLFEQISIWSEIRCDIYACKKGKDKFTMKNYYGVILKLMMENKNRKVKDFIITALAEKSSDLIVRIQKVTAYRKTENKIRFLVAVIIISSLLIGVIASYNLSTKLLKQYDEWVNNDFLKKFEEQENRKEIIVENFDEKYEVIKDKEIKILRMEEGYQNKWTLEGMKTYNIGKVYCRAGDSIFIHCTLLEGSSEYIESGIIDQEYTARYVKDEKIALYSFDIKEEGYYTIFVRNVGSSDVNAEFTYFL